MVKKTLVFTKMNNYYSVRPNVKDYMMFTLNDFELISLMPDFNIRGFFKPITWEWKVPNGAFVLSDKKTTTLPDITTWGGRGLVLSNDAKTNLEESLKECGELLPVSVEGKKYWFFNPTHIYHRSVIDEDRCEFEYCEGRKTTVTKFAFSDKADDIDKLVFTTDFPYGSKLFVTEDFKDLTNKHNLIGLDLIQAL